MKRTRLLYFFLIFFWVQNIHAQTYSLDSVPNPKKIDGGYISDPDHILTAETKSTLNGLFAELEQNTSDQVALVLLNSIGEEVPKDFANRLFNQWGIGKKGKDNGLLMLMVMDQRRIEFETGYGMEAVLPDAICKRIETNYMVPRFKEGNYDQGLLDGCKATIDILQNKENSTYFSEMETLETNPGENRNTIAIWLIGIWLASLVAVYIFFPVNHEDRSKLFISKIRWYSLYIIIPLAILGYLFLLDSFSNVLFYSIGLTYGYLAFILFEKRMRSNAQYNRSSQKKSIYEKYNLYTKTHEYWFWAAVVFPLPFLFYVLYYLRTKHTIRNHPRNCQNCSHALVKLSEKAEDQYLTKSQMMEEELQSVDYDVWYCTSCQSKEVLSFKNAFSSYSECRSCKAQLSYLESDVTLQAASYESSGVGRKTYKCKFCGYIKTKSYTIAQKQYSSDSSSSSSSDSSYSSSSDSGSSYDGGSSGGGGSGSDW